MGRENGYSGFVVVIGNDNLENEAVMGETEHFETKYLKKNNNIQNNIQLHGGDIYRNQVEVDYSVNTNPLGPPEGVLKILRANAEQIVHYPDMHCEDLKKKIAGYEQVSENEILCGNGAAELIYSVVQAIKPKRALITAPSFAEYELALRTVQAECSYYYCRETFDFQIQEDFLDLITEEIDILFLCNPGNPVGQTIEKEFLIRILNRCRECKVTVILDECFIEFLSDCQSYEMTALRYAYPNLFILKAFTKIFCMPGLRLGYMIGTDQTMLGKIREMLQPWNVSILAQLCGTEALHECEKYLEETKRFLKKEKTYIIEAIQELGDQKFQVYGSKANYIFFRGPEGLYEKALRDRMLIRDCGNYRGLSGMDEPGQAENCRDQVKREFAGYYRVAVRSQEENERLVAWLRKL